MSITSIIPSILTRAASADPMEMQAASSELQQLSENDPDFISQLATYALLNSNQSALSSNAQLLGLIHLKNIVLNDRSGCKIGDSCREFILNALLARLAEAVDGSQLRFISEILAAVFRHKWTNGTWLDELWDRLIELGAWLPLRRCIQRAASLRLQPRRKMLSARVSILLPQLAAIYAARLDVQLLHTIYTCITAIDHDDANRILLSLPEMTENLIWHAFTELKKPIESEQDNRLAKFLHAVFLILPENLRSILALQAVQILSEILLLTQRSQKAILWVLALLYNLLAADFGVPFRESFSKFPSLSEDARKQIQLWLLADGNVVRLVQCLTRNFMSLREGETDALFTDPEASYSLGGAQVSSNVSDANQPSHAVAISLWNLDGVLSGSATYILIGTRDLTPRQIAEAIFVLLSKNTMEDAESTDGVMRSIEDIPDGGLHLELKMRCIQLCLPHLPIESENGWMSLSHRFLQQDLWSASVNSSIGLTALCRQMTLRVQRTVLSIQPHQYTNTLVLLTQLIGYSDSEKLQSIGVRLAGAHCLGWLVQHSNFPPVSLVEVLPEVLDALINLAECVDEVETRLLVLSYIQSIFETVGVEESPQHSLQFLNVLDRLWRVGEGAAALRNSILSLIASLMYALNANTETGPAQNPGGLAAQLRDKVIAVVATDLTAANRVEDGDDDGVLFDSSLRLWHSLVTGKGAVWSEGLNHLMPVLTGKYTTDRGYEQQCAFDHTLYARLEYSEHAQLFFEIARGCLRLGSSPEFLDRWTEAFWAPALTEIVRNNAMQADRVSEKFAIGATATDNGAMDDEESILTLELLRLLVAWTSRLIDTGCEHISPSVSGLLVLHTHEVLYKAPLEVHIDPAFNSNQTRLLLLAQLACSPFHWTYLNHLIRVAQPSPKEVDFKQVCLTLASPNLIPAAGTSLEPMKNILARLLARADALSDGRHRRCFVVACVFCLLHLCPPSDDVLRQFLEPIVSLCVQVLSDSDAAEVYGDTWVPPKAVATHEATKITIRDLLTEWQKLVGGGDITLTCFANHVDPAILRQLNERLCFESNFT